ncbi:MAG: hypothetical protein ACTSVM_04375 [Candidatus Ranarchaeia archaeon]
MSTIKFDLQDELEEIKAKIYLDTHKKLTKKQVLELIFQIGKRDYERILKELQTNNQALSDKTVKQIRRLAEDFGPGTEDLSKRINEHCYGSPRGD